MPLTPIPGTQHMGKVIAFMILGTGKRAVTSGLRYPCMICRRSCEITAETRQSIRDCRRDRVPYVVTCGSCLELLSVKNSPHADATTITPARAMLGLDRRRR
jgi:hypothetical protein